MTDALSSTVPAGWYPDPWGSASQRWWDGSAWSGQLTAPPDASPSSEQTHDSPTEENYQPVAVRSTYTPPTPDIRDESPLPSRRALRQLALTAEPHVADVTPPVAEPAPNTLTADPLPAFTQVPEFTPEPVSALPPPVWTEPEMADAVAPAAVPTASVAAPDDDWAASLAGWADIDDTSATPPDTLPVFGDAPPISYSHHATRYQPLHGRTFSVWLIVFMPLIHAAALVGSLLLFPKALAIYASPASLLSDGATIQALGEWLVFAAAPLAIAFFLFTFIMGFQDRARLRLLGHDHTASPWWIVLHPLVYLIVRSVRVRQCTGRRGSGPLTTYLCFYVAPPIALAITTAVVSAINGAIPA